MFVGLLFIIKFAPQNLSGLLKVQQNEKRHTSRKL